MDAGRTPGSIPASNNGVERKGPAVPAAKSGSRDGAVSVRRVSIDGACGVADETLTRLTAPPADFPDRAIASPPAVPLAQPLSDWAAAVAAASFLALSLSTRQARHGKTIVKSSSPVWNMMEVAGGTDPLGHMIGFENGAHLQRTASRHAPGRPHPTTAERESEEGPICRSGPAVLPRSRRNFQPRNAKRPAEGKSALACAICNLHLHPGHIITLLYVYTEPPAGRSMPSASMPQLQGLDVAPGRMGSSNSSTACANAN